MSRPKAPVKTVTAKGGGCITCNSKSIAYFSIGGAQYKLCNNCYGEWLIARDEAVRSAFEQFIRDNS